MPCCVFNFKQIKSKLKQGTVGHTSPALRQNDSFCCMTLLANDWSLLQRMHCFLHHWQCTVVHSLRVHCQWGRKRPKLPLSLGTSSPCRSKTEPRPWATCTEKLV